MVAYTSEGLQSGELRRYAKPSRPVKFKPTVDRPHCIQCVGDFCLGKPAGMELRAASDPIDGLYGEEAVAAEAAEEALRGDGGGGVGRAGQARLGAYRIDGWCLIGFMAM